MKLKDFWILFNCQFFLLIVFSVVCLNKVMFLALTICDSLLTTLESQLSCYYECVNSPSYSVDGSPRGTSL